MNYSLGSKCSWLRWEDDSIARNDSLELSRTFLRPITIRNAKNKTEHWNSFEMLKLSHWPTPTTTNARKLHRISMMIVMKICELRVASCRDNYYPFSLLLCRTRTRQVFQSSDRSSSIHRVHLLHLLLLSSKRLTLICSCCHFDPMDFIEQKAPFAVFCHFSGCAIREFLLWFAGRSRLIARRWKMIFRWVYHVVCYGSFGGD